MSVLPLSCQELKIEYVACSLHLTLGLYSQDSVAGHMRYDQQRYIRLIRFHELIALAVYLQSEDYSPVPIVSPKSHRLDNLIAGSGE
jgi:hypothetical protein